jgi:hypothetical protein
LFRTWQHRIAKEDLPTGIAAASFRSRLTIGIIRSLQSPALRLPSAPGAGAERSLIKNSTELIKPFGQTGSKYRPYIGSVRFASSRAMMVYG